MLNEFNEQKLNRDQINIVLETFEQECVSSDVQVAFEKNPYLSIIKVNENPQWKRVKPYANQQAAKNYNETLSVAKQQFVFFSVEENVSFMKRDVFNKMMKKIHE